MLKVNFTIKVKPEDRDRIMYILGEYDIKIFDIVTDPRYIECHGSYGSIKEFFECMNERNDIDILLIL